MNHILRFLQVAMKNHQTNKQKILITGVLIVVAVSVMTLIIPTESYIYTQSDIRKANPNLVMGKGAFSMIEDIDKAKDHVVLTASGTVLSVGDPVDWIESESGEKYSSVPITIQIDRQTKNQEPHRQLKKGDKFTFYLGGLYEQEQFYINSFEPQFEIDEKILIHIGKSNQGPFGSNGDNYFVEIGKFGKYKVIEDKAYNEKYPTGKSLEKAYNEAK